MNCLDAQRKLEDFNYGELDGKTALEVQSHLRSCKECARGLESLRSEERIYRAFYEDLERGLDVSPETWERIQSGIAGQESRNGGRFVPSWLRALLSGFPRSPVLRQAVFAAAIVVLSVGATLLTMHYYGSRDSGIVYRHVPGKSDQLRSVASPYSLEAAIRSIERAENDYINAIGMLSRIVDKRKPSLDPQLIAEVEKNLRAIDESIAATRAAYYAHPSDPDLAHYMLTAYEKKVELLLDLAS